MYADIWFSYEATCSGDLAITTCNNTNFDTDLVVYQSTCMKKVQIACNGDDDNCPNYESTLSVPVTGGTQYLIRVGGWDSSSTGTGTLAIDCQ